MILQGLPGGGALAVAQPDHAALAGRLAEAWDDALTPAFRTAVAHHDDVWLVRDAMPPWSPATGLPESFLELSHTERRTVWERASELAGPLGAEAELWILRHAVRLHAHFDEAGLKAMTAQLADRAATLVEELREEHGPRFDDTALARGTALFALLDTIALRLSLGVREPVAAGVLTLRPVSDDRVEVAPWPFTGERVETHLMARTLPGQVESREALDAAWAATPAEARPVVLVRG
ncbi:MAG: DUF3891 family protein [Solirubrobacterales bacterium]|nr:DUF3891 family protein [Solirubrobacterales bacterium]